MKEILLPVHTGYEKLIIEEEHLLGVLRPHAPHHQPKQQDAVKDAMAHPIGSKTLKELAAGCRTAVIICSDHTRPVPSRQIIPEMLRELRSGSPGINVALLIATGFHRGTTQQELINKFGEEIVSRERIVIHDCDNAEMLVPAGTLPSGPELIVNRLALETDLLVAEGFIEPHFFAGFSGGRKSVLPGICGKRTILGNHCAEFINSPFARTGVLDGNPIHRDMLAASEMVKLRYIVNVALDEQKNVAAAFAGGPEKAHAEGCGVVSGMCGVDAVPADVVIVTNGGYPLDQNVYQCVKGMTAAEATAKKGAVIIMLAGCADGTGGESFYRTLKDAESPARLLGQISAVKQRDTIPDQWESQIMARVLCRHRVILAGSHCDRRLVEDMKLSYAATLAEAVEMARSIKGREASFTVIPDGISVIVREKVYEF